MRRILWIGLFELLVLLSFQLHAQSLSSDDQPTNSDHPVANNAQRQLTLSEGTTLHLQINEDVTSGSFKRGDHFKLHLSEPVTLDGLEVIHAGAYAEGEVVHAAKPGSSGTPGALILTARFIQVGDLKIKLRSYTGGTGKDNFGSATAVGVTIGFPAMFIRGKNIVIPAGTDVYAQVVESSVLTIADNQQETASENH